jgi:uncharacterized protein (TIGR03435 family)
MAGMRQRIVLALVAFAAIDIPVRAQSPAFEVASIKRNDSGSSNASSRALPGGRVSMTNRTLRDIVREVYRLPMSQIAGGPEWVDKDHWDIVAKAEGDPGFERIVVMMQGLLAERFKVVLHREPREQSIYALVFARADRKLGPQIRPSSVDCDALVKAAAARGGMPPRTENQRPLCGTSVTYGKMMTSATTMADLVRVLTGWAGRSIVDKTGLSGTFDIDLTWTPEPAATAGGPAPAPSEGASLFTAIQEQLGLKLDAQRGPVEMLVIGSAERPVED